MIETFISILASLLVLAPLDSSTPPDFGAELQQFASEFNSGAAQLIAVIDSTMIDLTRMAYITVLIIGVFLYFTRLNRRLGRELITGGIALAILSEFIFPAISKL
jgi:hypothetical protein